MEQQAEETARPQRVISVPPGLSRGAPVPWWGKLGVKLGLAAVGLHGARVRAIGFGRHSFHVSDSERLLGARHWLEQAEGVLGRRPRTLLEIGPGGMVVRAPVLAGLGLQRIWFSDIDDSGTTEPGRYLAAAAAARAHGIPAPDLSRCADRAAILARCNASLLIGGAAVLAAIPDGSIDLVVSEATMEHVRRDEMAPLLVQLRRVTAPDGMGLHMIDFMDHLGGGLQHLRFSDQFWASPLVGRAGVYVNRLGLSAMVSRFRRAHFEVAVPEAIMWAKRPPGPEKPHPEAMRPAADDLVAQATLIVRPGE
jgi:hypothetical protein